MNSAQQGEGFPVFHTFTALEWRLTEVFRRMWLIPDVQVHARGSRWRSCTKFVKSGLNYGHYLASNVEVIKEAKWNASW